MQGSLHFVGIGGIGMSAIARVLLARGETITGSDTGDSPLVAELRALGATVTIGHKAENVNGARTIVVSSAIDADNPEYAAARAARIPIVRRGEMLRTIMEGARGIAVCGTHGKTTTTAMIAAVLRESGIDASLVLGGIDVVTKTNGKHGSDPYFLTEADESDGSFALLDPAVAVLTNIENDHLSSDEQLAQLVDSFAAFLEKIPDDGTAIVGMDNANSAAIAPLARRAKTVTFALRGAADLTAANVRLEGLSSTFDVIGGGVCLGTIELHVPGTINIENALAAVAAGRALDVPFAKIKQGLAQFRGVRRRFEILAQTPRMTVVDDYAHHPTAVRATIEAARGCTKGPLIVAFQPHRYTRTAYLAQDFARALQGADRVYLAPVYAASEPPIEGVSERSIGEPLAQTGSDVRYVKYVHDLRTVLAKDAPEGALVLMLGAGNITKAAADLAADLFAQA
ncbi:MAG TPA: UDP-N-acetylmuramate--L-alanine ligase [Candidatus Baltobacteraceae bacterium]|nr:UDP-N-acetylmuramate--L-alanine ligase [Candidatus Baltobacteraceae bacterium]